MGCGVGDGDVEAFLHSGGSFFGFSDRGALVEYAYEEVGAVSAAG